ncbi:MAG: phospholipase A [Proteobacteria bacterium]|nr:phospholipase A [Pseudomonadota bacterium]
MKILIVSTAIIFHAVLSASYNCAATDIVDRMAECAKIESNNERLKCFDNLAGQKTPMKTTAQPIPLKTTDAEITPAEKTARIETTQDNSKPSIMSKHWELDPLSRKSAQLIRIHRPNYILPVAYNSSLNNDPILDVDRNAKAQNTEAKFQISFKVKLWEDVMDKDVDLWFGYTQLAFWQLYNSAFSSPIRETDYEPELLLNFRTDYDILGLKGRIINVGLNHQSNGRAQPLSRSWNRIVANFGFEKDDFNLLLKTWYRIPENSSDDDNPDINKYMGYGEIWGTYYWKKHRFSAMFRNNLRINENRNAVQLDWSFPFPYAKSDRVSGYVQYFNGYGESLLDYNANANRIGIGVMLTDWN